MPEKISPYCPPGIKTRPARLHMTPGMFAVFFANEPHMPKLFDGIHVSVHKLVIKIPSHMLEGDFNN